MSKPREAFEWVLAQHPESRINTQSLGIHFRRLQGWVPQRGYPSYRIVMTDYDSESEVFSWDEYAISRVGKVYRVQYGLAEHKEIWTP